jgi:endonuclease/exonuclease/phosphatase (EEP) superfamily protein YafD
VPTAVLWLVTFAPTAIGPLTAPQADPGDTAVRVVSWNGGPRWLGEDLPRLVAGTDPDVLVLQEVVPNQREVVVASAPDLQFRHFADISPLATGGGGTVVLSRFPIVSVRPVDGLPRGARPADIVTVDVDGTRVDIASVHMSSPRFGAGPARVGEEARRRVIEARALADATRGSGRVVVAGDFNSDVLNDPYGILKDSGLSDVQRDVGWGVAGTRLGLFRADWVLSRGVRPLSARAEGLYGSDHRAVSAVFSLP